MRIESWGEWPDRLDRLSRARSAGSKVPPSELPAVPPVDPVPDDEAALIAAVRAELDRIADDSTLAQGEPCAPGEDENEVLARAIGRRLYEYRRGQRPPVVPELPIEVRIQMAHAGRGWKRLGRTVKGVVLEVRMEQAVLRKILVYLPYWRPGCIDEDDVRQQATAAVLEALQTYRPECGLPLGDWLDLSVRNNVRSHLLELHPLSAHRVAQIRKMTAMRLELEQRLGRDPTDGELALEMGTTVEVLYRVEDAAYAEEVLSLEDLPAAETLPGGELATFEQVWTRLGTAQIKHVLSKLPPDLHRFALRVYRDGVSERDLALEMGCSKSSVHRMNVRLKARLRELFGVADESSTSPATPRDRQPGKGGWRPLLRSIAEFLVLHVRRRVWSWQSRTAEAFRGLQVVAGLIPRQDP